MKNLVFLSILFLTSCSLVTAQEFESHTWKNRVLVILADTQDNKTVKKQLQSLREDFEGLKDRKLVLYLITPTGKKCNFDQVTCLSNRSVYDKYKKFKGDFEILLIGLDGGKKLQQNLLLSTQQLFDKIDAMPMRAQELRKN